MRIATAILFALGTAASAQTPAFDAVSIKPNTVAAGGRIGGGGGALQFQAGRVVGRNVTARRVILAAYHLTPFQLAGGPAWLDSDRFDIEAKTETATTSQDQLRQMLRTMLADRFQLTLTRGTKEMPVYALTVGKKGSKLPEWKEGEPMPKTADPPGAGRGGGGGGPSGGVFMDHMTVQAFAETLTNDPHIGRPVLDKTGLDGLYLVRFAWDDDDSFISAVEEATGLKFEAQKAPLGFFTVEHVEKPSGN